LQNGDLVNVRPFLSRCLGPLLVAMALTVGACDPQPPASTMTIQQPSQGTQNLRLGEYRVAPGDRLRVVVLSDTELSGEYEVDSTGMISPRMAGRVRSPTFRGSTSCRRSRLPADTRVAHPRRVSLFSASMRSRVRKRR